MTNYKLTNEQFEQLFSGDTTVSELKTLISQVEVRFSYIIRTIDRILDRDHDWYDFDNESKDHEKRGYFDPQEYKDTIDFVGALSFEKNPEFNMYSHSFPTAWLKEDFEDTLQNQLAQFKLSEKNKKDNDKEKQLKEKETFLSVRDSILKKLTSDELKYISFKAPKEIAEMVKKEDEKHLKEKKRAEHIKKIQPFIDAKKNKPN